MIQKLNFAMTLVLAAFIVILSCSSKPVPPPSVAPDASLAPTCAGVCARMQELHCLSAEPTPKGATCETVCLNIQGAGVLRWDLACRVSAGTCAAMDRCEVFQ